jgi:predicted PurR-regulated permease PerM
MVKVIIRETIVALLVCLAVLLILSIVFYNYIPANKVIPEAIEYTPSNDIQTQLSSAVEDNSNEILMTYEITAQDLENYEKTNDYNPGKANPFSAVTEETTSKETSSGSSSSSGNTISSSSDSNNSSTSSSEGSSSTQSGGTLFESSSSK